MKASILIVDDDASLRRALADRLRYWGHTCEEASSGTEAVDATNRRRFDLILLDLRLPDGDGLEVLRRLRGAEVTSDIVMLTAHGTVDAAVEAIRAGADDFLLKPADFEWLRKTIDRSLHKARLERANRALLDRLEEGATDAWTGSPSLRELFETASLVAQSNATVLLTGESGTGKQVLADFLHHQSPRRAGPFVYVNCVAISDELIESTLFGHERGAFTGADRRTDGRFSAAAGGTAFLDEVGDISASLQTKLLHFLESGEYERVGGNQTLSVDCRIVAATNRNLEAAVAEGSFRADLFYRLNVIHLRLPPLRERRGDIPALAEGFLAHQRKELGRRDLKFAARTLEILSTYSWPGNVRQLKNAVERMTVLARTSALTPDLLPPEVFAGPAVAAEPDTSLPLREAMRRFKRSRIATALARAGGNQRIAAEELGIQRTFLNRLIRELDIDPGKQEVG